MAPILTCIVLDDDPLYLELVTRCFARSPLNIRVNEFFDGLDALEFLQGKRVDFILTDLRMPAMDGLTFIEEVRQRDRDIPVIAMSSDDSMADEAIACGATAFVSKDDLTTTLPPTLNAIAGEASLTRRDGI